MWWRGTSLSLPLIQEGKVSLGHFDRSAVSGVAKRSCPEGIGYKDVDVSAWSGIFAPIGMQLELARAIQQDVAATINRPEYAADARSMGYTIMASGPPQFNAYVTNEVRRYMSSLPPLGIQLTEQGLARLVAVFSIQP